MSSVTDVGSSYVPLVAGDSRATGHEAVGHRQAITLLERLVRSPSVSGHEQAAVRLLVEQMSALGFDAFVDGAGNAVGSIGEGRPQTVLLGHIDTVPGEVPIRIEDSRLYGRGAVDAKGPLAAFVMAAARLSPRFEPRLAGDRRLRGNIVVIGCVEEEAPSSRGAHYAAECYQPDLCIVGEPSGWNRVTIGYKSTLRLVCRAETPCGHSAHNQQTAAERICALWQRLQSHAAHFNADRERTFDRLLPALLRLGGDSDGLREWAMADISVRLPHEIAPDALVATLRRWDREIEFEVMGATPAFLAERTTPLVRALTHSIRQQGTQPGLVLKSGTSDMNLVGPAWGCPIAAYGPGDAALDHTPDEHISLDEYLRGIAVLEGALERLHI